jgi:hypothetical protein
VSGILSGNQKAEAGCEESPGHVREREQQKRAATEGVDCPNGGL